MHANLDSTATVATQAPQGGATSPLNGEFYKGGQFMCTQVGMPKGYRQKLTKAVEKRTAKTRNIAEITVNPDRVVIRMAGEMRTDCVFRGAYDQCVEFARQLVAAKVAIAEREFVMPHPTNVVFAG